MLTKPSLALREGKKTNNNEKNSRKENYKVKALYSLHTIHASGCI